jgi:TetR/AcrR family transcriptional regulator, lmrAB and yxaGH operons repressor
MSMVIDKSKAASGPIAEPAPAAAKRRDGRDRLLYGAGRLLAERGYAKMELRDVAERGEAPRGSIYHHFPGGKVQLAAEAAALDGVRVRTGLERSLAQRGLKQTLKRFGDVFRHRAAGDPERIGCSVAAAALARAEDPALAAAATAVFESWESAIAAALRREGVAAKQATTFAAMVVSTIEGALVRSRAAGDLGPLDSAIAGLEQALDALPRSTHNQRS